MVPGTGGGGGGGGVRGTSWVQRGNVGQQGVDKSAEDMSVQKDQSGLNPDRQRGFGDKFPRIETPRLADMRAKQGAVVARFLTFFQRKSSLVVELYNAAFYKQKPNWDKIANVTCVQLVSYGGRLRMSNSIMLKC